MENSSQPPASGPPPKPWERAGSSSSPVPFKPSSAGSTSDIVESSGTANLGEIVSAADRNATVSRNTLGRTMPTRPWEQQAYGSTYTGFGSGLNYNTGYGTGMYGSYGGLGSLGSYGGGLYGNIYNRGGYGGLYGGSMYGGGMYNSGSGGPMGGYGIGMGGPYGEPDPNSPFGAPSSPPGFWISLMRVVSEAKSLSPFLSLSLSLFPPHSPPKTSLPPFPLFLQKRFWTFESDINQPFKVFSRTLSSELLKSMWITHD